MRLGRIVGMLSVLAAATACLAPTTLTAVWRDPAATGVKFKKVLAAAQTADQARRRAIEAYLAKRIANATPSYEILSGEEVRNTDQAKAKVAAAGFDGAVIVRFVGTTQETTYVPGTSSWGAAPYGSMYGYWGYGYGAVYDPGYMQTDTVVTLETNVYSVATEKLLWSSRSETISPSNIDNLMQSVVDATVKEMKKQKVLQ